MRLQEVSNGGLALTSTGRITVSLFTTQVGAGEVYIGSTGIHPVIPPGTPNGTKFFTLDPNNSNHHGIKPHVPNTNKGLYVGLNTTTTPNKWEVWLSPGPPPVDVRGYIQVVNADPGVTLANLTVFPNSIKAADLPMLPRLLMNTTLSGWQDETAVKWPSNMKVSCSSVVAADFDSDMDQDIFMACRGGVQNLPDILMENNGTGVFNVVPLAGGAQGIIGAGINSNTGTGSDVVVADFDVNGFPDLFVTNGLNLEPDRIGGPDQLFLNKGSPNHWVKIHLVGKVSDPSGIVSNRDAIGAKVRAIAGGVTQTLEQSGGYHRWSQSLSNPVHIGLGTNTQARIEVVWPSGRVDTFLNVQANDVDGSAFYRVTEGNASNTYYHCAGDLGASPAISRASVRVRRRMRCSCVRILTRCSLVFV